MMRGRPKVESGRKFKTATVSLHPKQLKFANSRAVQANISFSKYIQALVRLDMANNVLGQALTQTLEQA